MHAELNCGRITIFNSFPYKDSIKQIRGRYWDVEKKVWTVPFSEENVLTLGSLGCAFGRELQEKAGLMLMNKSVQPVKSDPLEPMPIKAVPYIHQIEAFNRACSTLGILKGGAFHG